MKELVMNNGLEIPVIGYGTYKNPDDSEGERATIYAVECGYSLFDTASAYENEESVGHAIRHCGVQREKLFVTTKVNNPDRGYDSTLRAFESSMKKLGLDYLDLYLIHWPASPSRFTDWERINRDTWKAMERLVDEHCVRTIGLSNFLPAHLEPLLAQANISPAVNQIEFHPGWMQPDCTSYCKERGIIVEAWSPLGRERIFQEQVLRLIAASHEKSVAQICLRWEIQHGVVPIPKSMTPARILENIDVFDFKLSEKEMQEIDQLPTCGYSGLHPDTIDF